MGCFELGDHGILGIADPSGLFISRRTEPVPGTCVTVALEGSRPLLAEVQALVAATSAGSPRRATSGLDSSRVAMVMAVLERRADIKALPNSDTYVATVGGVRLTEPASDLAVALALAGGVLDLPLAHGTVAVGEVGLAGEVRRVTGLGRRLSEAARLGYRYAIVPRDPGRVPEGLTVLEVDDVRGLLSALRR